MLVTNLGQINSQSSILERLLASALAPRAGFVFEKADPLSRAPLKSFVGLDCSVSPIGDAGSSNDEFTTMLDERRKNEAHGGGYLLLSGYHSTTAGTGVVQSAAPTPRQMLIEPGQLLCIDHGTGEITLADYRGAAADADMLRGILHDNRAPPRLLDRSEVPPLAWTENMTQAEFVESAEKIIAMIAAEPELEGVVLSICQSADYRCDPVTLYRYIKAINPSPYTFMVRDGDFAVVGATSLRLLSGHGKLLVAETDGATHKVEPGAPTWVPSDKELSEYYAVVHGLKEDMGPLVKPGTLNLTVEQEIRQFFNLAHIYAEMQGELRPEIGALGAIAQLSPHGATVGYPRHRAAAIIEAIETTPRGVYAGSVGFFADSGDFEFAAVIRSLWLQGENISFQAGAKIVAGSDPASEYAECLMKMQSLRDCVSLAYADASAPAPAA